jgi:hypothetical protein
VPAPFVAFQNGSVPLASPELIVPGTAAAANRDLLGLVSLQLLSVAALPTGAGGESNAVQLSGAVTNPGSYDRGALQTGITAVSQTVGTHTYTGVPLYTFLDPTNSNSANQLVVVQAIDGLEVVVALAELDPAFGGSLNDLLPYADTGGNFPVDGVARTIFPTDNAHGRWVSNVDSIEVAPVPEPGSLTLLTVALIAMATVRSRMLQRLPAACRRNGR